MEYLNIPTALFSSPAFIGAEPVQRATWISLLGWSVKQENGGIIPACRDWNDRRWMQTCGVTHEEVQHECELFQWKGKSLHIWGYPHQVQATIELKREIARKNGKLGGRPPGRTRVGKAANPKPDSEKTHVGCDTETYIGTGKQSPRKEESKGRKEERNLKPSPYLPDNKGIPASVREVRDYLAELNIEGLGERERNLAAEAFYEHFEEKGWSMKSWKQRAAKWAKEDAANIQLRQNRQKIPAVKELSRNKGTLNEEINDDGY